MSLERRAVWQKAKKEREEFQGVAKKGAVGCV